MLVITLMLFQSVPLMLAVLAVLPLLAAASIWYRHCVLRVQMRIRETMATMLTHVNESLVGMRVVQAFVIEPEQHEVFRDVSLDTYDAKRRAGGVTAVYSAAVEFLVPLALAVLIGVGSHLVANGTVKIGAVIVFQPLHQPPVRADPAVHRAHQPAPGRGLASRGRARSSSAPPFRASSTVPAPTTSFRVVARCASTMCCSATHQARAMR